MGKKYNVFIEGIPGSGKTTLLKALAEKLPDYKVYFEGDISPVELAWCSYMTDKQYENTWKDLPDFREQIQANTVCENGYYITSYTRIKTEDYQFYQYMEKFEVYGARRSIPEFRDIIMRRFKHFNAEGNLFECSFFQNIIEELMLFGMYSSEQIVDFYRELIDNIDLSRFKLIRLNAVDIEDSIMQIKGERVNENGEEIWYSLMLDYLNHSPYGKQHGFRAFEDLISHFKRRMVLEKEVLNILPPGILLEVESKNYSISDIMANFSQTDYT